MPLSEQVSIADQIDAAFARAERLEAEAARAKETQRRAKKAAKGADEDSDTPLLDRAEDDEAADA